MNSKLDKDLIKFWQWCGFKFNDATLQINQYDELPELNLDSIYKYAIPRLQNEGYTIELFAFEQIGFRVIIENIIGKTGEKVLVEAITPINALYNAIIRIINGEKSVTATFRGTR